MNAFDACVLLLTLRLFLPLGMLLLVGERVRQIELRRSCPL